MKQRKKPTANSPEEDDVQKDGVNKIIAIVKIFIWNVKILLKENLLFNYEKRGKERTRKKGRKKKEIEIMQRRKKSYLLSKFTGF